MAIGGSVYSTFADWFAKQIVDRASGRITPSDAVGGDLVRRTPGGLRLSSAPSGRPV